VTTDNARILVEACVDSVASSVAAERGGAHRLELCDALFDGGTTPSAGMIAACKATVSIPLFVMIRPRGGGFVYSDAERDVMRRDVVVARELGADGVVIGGLRPDGAIDLEFVQSLVEAARRLPVTFHRAFDLTPDLAAALESLAAAGVQRVLTAGGALTAAEGAMTLASLVRQAGSRLVVMAGGGVREENVRSLVSASGVREVHVRLTRLARGGELPTHRELRVRRPLPEDEAAWEETDEQRMQSFVSTVAAARTTAQSNTRLAISSTPEETKMASSKQKSAARKNVKKAARAAKRKKTISKLPKKTRTALGKKGAEAAKRKRRGS
jgi:copper homeostasis protein